MRETREKARSTSRLSTPELRSLPPDGFLYPAGNKLDQLPLFFAQLEKYRDSGWWWPNFRIRTKGSYFVLLKASANFCNSFFWKPARPRGWIIRAWLGKFSEGSLIMTNPA